MSTFVYTRPSEAIGGTFAVNTGVEDTGYLAANIDDGKPEKPAKLTGTTGSWVRSLAAPTQCDFVAIINSNLGASVDVRLQGHTSNAWGAPTLNVGFTIPARLIDQFTVNAWLDLSAIFPSAANRTFQYWRLLVNSANPTPVSVGEWKMYTAYHTFGVRNINLGSTRHWRRPVIVHETDMLVRRTYDLGTTVRACDVDLQATPGVRNELEILFRDAQGPTRPFVIIPNRNEDDAWMVTLMQQDQTYKRSFVYMNELSLSFQELSRGLYPS